MAKYVPKEISKTDAAYIAGIIDGEGSLTIAQCGFTKGGSPQWQVIGRVSNTEEALIDYFVEKFGSKKMVYSKNQHPKNSKKTVYTWQCTGERLRHLLNLMLPYTIIKKRQVEIMLEMLDSFKLRFYGPGNSGPQISQEVIDYRYRLKEELHSLHNRKGRFHKKNNLPSGYHRP